MTPRNLRTEKIARVIRSNPNTSALLHALYRLTSITKKKKKKQKQAYSLPTKLHTPSIHI